MSLTYVTRGKSLTRMSFGALHSSTGLCWEVEGDPQPLDRRESGKLVGMGVREPRWRGKGCLESNASCRGSSGSHFEVGTPV